MKSQNGWVGAPTGAGVTGPHRNRPAARQRGVGRIAGTAITAILATTLTPWAAAPAHAATPPVFPDNITVFPDRDFVAIDYPEREGQIALITVTRGGVMIGRAEGEVASPGLDPETGQPEPAMLEVNHPGGVCWGTGAGAPAVTPDLQAGDEVSVAFGGVTVDSSVAQSPTVTGFSQGVGLASNVVTVDGTLDAVGGPVADTANLEQRIVAPALTGTPVGRRDVRAGDATPGVFSSSITFTATTFTATYTFNDPAVAATAAAGQARALTWMASDADANRQGITIAEFGEVGGDGIGGCAAGTPGAATAPTTPVAATATAGNFSAVVSWREQAAGGSPIIANWVRVVNAQNQQVSKLRRALPGDVSLMVTGLTGQPYRFQVAAQNSVGLSGFSLPSAAVTPRSMPGKPVIGAPSSGSPAGLVNAAARWAPPASNGGFAINGYVVTALRMSAGGAVVKRTTSAVQPATARVLAMVLPSGFYRFEVRARNALGLSVVSTRSTLVTAK